MFSEVVSIFTNYEIHKLEVSNPNLVNYIIFILFSLSALFTLKKKNNDHRPLTPVQTDQIKGIAIFFVILGHLWVHVAKDKASMVFSNDSVGFFLILSGFGLTKQHLLNNTHTFMKFCSKRIKKVIYPYWISTILYLSVDYFFAGKTYSLRAVLLSILGMNFSIEVQLIDYVRWFISYIIIWYLAFFFTSKWLSKRLVLCLSCLAIILLLSEYYVLHVGWYSFFSFPFGCFLAINYNILIKSKSINKLLIWPVLFCCITCVLIRMWIDTSEVAYYLLTNGIPSLFFVFFQEFHSIAMFILFAFFFVIIGKNGYHSSILLVLGRYSFELFLLHALLLIKYNPIITNGDYYFLPFQFIILILLLLFFSYLFQKLSSGFYAKSVF